MLSSLSGLSGYVYAALGIGGLVTLASVVFLIMRFIDKTYSSGADAQRADRAEKDLELAKKQGEVMTRDETADDTAKSLDDGSF